MENDVPDAPQPAADGRDDQSATDPLAARAALDAVAESKALVAEQMRRGPRWYNAAYGFGCGLLVLSVGLPQPWFIVGLVLTVTLMGALIGVYRRTTGIVLGAGNPRPRGIYPWLIAVLVVCGGASYLDGNHGFPLGVPIVAVCAGVACWVLSRRYDAALFALLEGEQDGEARP